MSVEPPPAPPIAAPLVAPTTATIARTTTIASKRVTPTPVASKAEAQAVRSAMLSRRKQVKDRVRELQSKIAKLEGRLEVTGPRNDQRDVLNEVGRTRGELARMQTIHQRCERAFDGDDWSEIEAAWLLAEDLDAEQETAAADENYLRFIDLVADFRASCEALEPLEGAR